MNELKYQTECLKKYLDELKERYDNNDPPASIKDKKFFAMMKENTMNIYELLENWEEHALQIIKERKVNVHPHQIISTKENIELLILHSYYIDAKKKRYMELHGSSHYIFDQLLRSISSK